MKPNYLLFALSIAVPLLSVPYALHALTWFHFGPWVLLWAWCYGCSVLLFACLACVALIGFGDDDGGGERPEPGPEPTGGHGLPLPVSEDARSAWEVANGLPAAQPACAKRN